MENLPLSGLCVLEFGNSIAAPYAGLILSELGAEVIKIERTGAGDPVRDWGPPYSDGKATTFEAINRSKKGLAVDFNDPTQMKNLLDFFDKKVDIVLQNMRSGVMERFGLGGSELIERKPSLIYCNLHAFGAVGPSKNKPGYDPLMQASSGMMSINGEGLGRPPVRVGVSIVDMGAGLWSVIGILTALNKRNTTGQGTVVDVSLYETALAWMLIPLSTYFASGKMPKPEGSGLALIVPYQVFSTADQDLMVAAGNDGLFMKLCNALECPEIAIDERFRTNGNRVVNRDILIPTLQSVFSKKDLNYWRKSLDVAGVPNAPIQTVGQAVSDPQTIALDMIRSISESSLPYLALPLSMNGYRPGVKGRAPQLGQHNEEILKN